MSFSFMRSTSHRSDDEHLDEEEEDDATGQMPVRTSGGVRAFSHLPVPKKPWQDAAAQELLGGDGRERPFMPPEPVNKPYFGPSESVNKPAFGPSKPDYDVYVKPPGHRPADDYDLYRKPPNHRREDDYDFYKKKKPNPLLDYLPPLEEDEDEHEMRPPARSGMVRAFSHLPERREAEDADFDAKAATGTYAEQEDADFEAPAPDRANESENPDEPPYSIGVPPTGRSRFLEQREMPPGWQGREAEENARGRGFFQSVADVQGRPAQQGAASAPTNQQGVQQPPSNLPPSTAKAAPASPKPQTPVQGPVPGTSQAQPPARQLTETEREELFTDEGEERKPKGQLGVSGKTDVIDPHKSTNPNPAERRRKPTTVCLYDGGEVRNKDEKNYQANAESLRLAAATYASDSTWMIDISQKGWQDKLKAIQKAAEGQGNANNPDKGIDRIMIFDHGSAAEQEFGASKLEPGSPEWQIITSSVRPRGDVVLMGCEVAKEGWNDRNPYTNVEGRYLAYDGPEYLNELYRNSNVERSPTIHAYDANVRHRKARYRHSVTLGKQHSVSIGGHTTE